MQQRTFYGNTNTWGDIVNYEGDIPSFYKNYSDLNSLASALSGQFLGSPTTWADDLDTITTVGVYRAYNASGAPSQGASYRVIVSKLYDGSGNILIQNAINKLNEAYHRTKCNNGEWTSWIKY